MSAWHHATFSLILSGDISISWSFSCLKKKTNGNSMKHSVGTFSVDMWEKFMDKNSIFLINRIVQKDANMSNVRKYNATRHYHLVLVFLLQNTFHKSLAFASCVRKRCYTGKYISCGSWVVYIYIFFDTDCWHVSGCVLREDTHEVIVVKDKDREVGSPSWFNKL